MQAEYYEKVVYGKTLYYPANDTARVLCELANQKTADSRIVKLSKSLGITWLQVLNPQSPRLIVG